MGEDKHSINNPLVFSRPRRRFASRRHRAKALARNALAYSPSRRSAPTPSLARKASCGSPRIRDITASCRATLSKPAMLRVLTSSPRYGVDSFTKCFGSQFVFLQGHPEYDANSLAREYRRDMDLYLRGETDRVPTRPEGYFGAEAEAKLSAMCCRAHGQRSQKQIQDLSIIEALAPAEGLWRAAAVSFFRSWIEMVTSEINHASNKGFNAGKEYYYANIPHAN